MPENGDDPVSEIQRLMVNAHIRIGGLRQENKLLSDELSQIRAAVVDCVGEPLPSTTNTVKAVQYLISEYRELAAQLDSCCSELSDLTAERDRLRAAHWRHPDVDRWLENRRGVQVEALSGQDGKVLFSGDFMGYADFPQVKIKLAPGTYKFWAASLVREKQEKTS